MSEEKKKDPVRFVLTTRDKLFGVEEDLENETLEMKDVKFVDNIENEYLEDGVLYIGRVKVR